MDIPSARMRKSIYTSQYAIFLKSLVQARVDVGLTQVVLAKKLRTTQSIVSKIERGERRLDVIELVDWCRALGVSFTAFASNLEESLR